MLPFFSFSGFSFSSLASPVFRLCAPDGKKYSTQKKKVFNAQAVTDIAVDDNDSRRRRLAVIFFIPESLLAKSC